MNQVLADTSVWIAHFRKPNTVLQSLLYSDQVVCHPLVLIEIACGAPTRGCRFLVAGVNLADPRHSSVDYGQESACTGYAIRRPTVGLAGPLRSVPLGPCACCGEDHLGRSTSVPDVTSAASGSAPAIRSAGRTGLALARRAALAGGPASAGHSAVLGSDAGCRRLRTETLGSKVHLMLLWIGGWAGGTLSIRGSRQLNETANRAGRWPARYRTSS